MKEQISMDKLAKQIREKNISVPEIAKKTGYSRVSVYRYLNKERTPNIDFINKLLELLK